MSNDYIRLDGVPGNVWIKPNGLNQVYVDASQNSAGGSGNYAPEDRLAPRYLTHRGQDYVHGDNWQRVGDEWLPVAYARDGNTVITIPLQRAAAGDSIAGVRRRGATHRGTRYNDAAPVTYADALLRAIQKALAAWYEQPGSIRLLAEAHAESARMVYEAATRKHAEAAEVMVAAAKALGAAAEACAYADGLVRQMVLEAVEADHQANIAVLGDDRDDITGRTD